MTKFEAICYSVKSQVKTILARRAVEEPGFDPLSEESVEEAYEALLHEAASMVIGAYARLSLINDAKNDQATASARELLLAFGRRLGINISEQLGIPVDSEV